MAKGADTAPDLPRGTAQAAFYRQRTTIWVHLPRASSRIASTSSALIVVSARPDIGRGLFAFAAFSARERRRSAGDV